MKTSSGPSLLPGISSLVAATNELIRQAASNDHPVLITGEVGTEKSFAAKLIHQFSERASRPLTKVSVSWKLPPDLPQYFSQGDGGTLLINLQKEFPIDMQYTLVELASDGSFADPLSGQVIEADVRIVIVTSLDLESISSRTPLLPELREILYGQMIEIPPLRERLEDIPALVRYALKRAADTGRTTARSVDPQVLSLFRRWNWPGNAEDLLLVTAQAAIAAKSDMVTIDDLPETFIRQIDENLVKAARSMKGGVPAVTERRSSPAPSQIETAEDIAEEPTQTGYLAEPASEESTLFDPRALKNVLASADTSTPARVASTTSDDALPIPAMMGHPEPTPTPSDESHEEAPAAAMTPDQEEQARLGRHLLALARRLRAQSLLLKNQMAGPLAQNDAQLRMDGTSDVSSDREALAALEGELDRGLDMVMSLRRQMAMLNIRQQQTAETIRDLVARISLITEETTGNQRDRQEAKREAIELAETLGQIDTIVQRVSQEVPLLGKHFDDIITGPQQTRP